MKIPERRVVQIIIELVQLNIQIFFIGSNFELFIYLLYRETSSKKWFQPPQAWFYNGKPGERNNTLCCFQIFCCVTLPSHWYLSESTQKEYAAKCCNFLKMILGTNSWSQYLKKMGHWNMMTIKRNDSSLERFSKMGISTSSIKKANS